MARTTDLIKLKEGYPFTWGKLIGIHEIGEYSIVEYHPWVYFNQCGTNQVSDSTEYHCYVDGYDLSYSSDSLDSALATCIAYKHDGCASQAANYFMKMIKNEEVR